MDKVLTDVEIGWAAGFIDGEGCVSIHRIRDRRTAHYRTFRLAPRLSVGQCDRRPLDRLADMFGGCVRLRKAAEGNHRDAWMWELNGARLVTGALRTVLPALSVKYDESLVVLELCDRLTAWPTGRLLTDEEIALRNAISERLTTVKYTGRGASAVRA